MLDFSPFFRWISAPRFSLLACGLLLMALAMPGRMSATHITGAEITYRCLNSSTNLYEVTVSVYRDCVNGQAPFDNNITLYIFRGANNSLFTTRNISLPNNGIEIIPAFWNSCTGQPYNLCVEYARYVTNVVLPPTPGGYNIGWARCCRNNIVTNIAGNQGITVVAKVPGPEHAVCNNSPIFNQLPPLFLCVGQPFFFNHSAIDADGDSLVYAISNPFTGTNFGNQGATQTQPVVGTGFGAGPMGPPPYRNVNFLPGYSFSNPFGSGNFAIDPQSGALSLTPTQVGVSVFAISVFEYRNGVLLSENKRDFQINVINCQPQGLTPNLNTNTSGVPNNSNDTLFVDPLQPFCYTMTLQDPNPADVVQLFPVSAGFGIGGTLTPPYATLTTSGTNPVTGTVCWTPSCAYAGQTVNLIIGGRDTNDCPGYNLVFDTVTVVVRQPAAPAISHTGPGGSTAKVFNVNPNTNFCYNFTANDADASDVLQITPIEGPFQALGGSGPFATLSSNGTNPVTGQVCWNIPCTAAGQTVRFVLRARDVNLCNYTVFDTVTLIIAPKPAFGASNDTSICLGQTARMTAFGGVGYNWLPQTALSNPNSPGTFASPAQTTSYQVRIFDLYGCEARDTVVVEVRPLPLANAGPDLVRCPDSFVTLQATGGVSYSWSPAINLSATNIPNPQASPTGAVNYVVRVTGANGCSANDTVRVNVFQAFSGLGQAICFSQQTAQLSSAALNAVTYSWLPTSGLSNPNISNPVASPGTTTTYTVTITGNTGCVDTARTTVLVRPLPVVDLGADRAICFGGQATLTATGAPSFVWQPAPSLVASGATATVTPTVSTTYRATGTDGFGCFNSDTVRITVNPLPVANAGNDTVKCGTTGIVLQGSGGVSYQWSPATGLSTTGISNPTANPDSSTTYVLRVTDANGCQDTDTVNVTAMYANAGPGATICEGDSIRLQASGGGSYRWSPGLLVTDSLSASPLAFPSVTTDFIVTAIDPTGCSDTNVVRIVVNAYPPAFAGPDTAICINDTLSLRASGGVSFAWAPSPFIADVTNPGSRAWPTASSTFVVAVTDTNGCTQFDSVRVTVNPLPVANAGPDVVKCGDSPIPLNGSGGVQYEWTPPTGLSDPLIANPLAGPDSSTTYVLRVTDANGCQDTDTVFLRTMYANAGPDQPLCIFDTLSLSASGGVAYQWNPEPDLTGGNTATPQVFPLATKAYSVLVTDISGCTDRDTVLVTINPLPVTSTSGTDPFVCSNGGTRVNATGGVNYLWSPAVWFPQPDTASPLAFPVYSGIPLDSTVWFYVTVTDTNGCSSRDSLSQVVRKQPVITTTPDTVKCPGTTVTLRATGGIAYEWFPATALSATNVPVVVANPLVTTDYAVRIAAVWGCADTGYVRVIVMDPDAGPDVTVCFGDTIVLGGRGGVAFSWDNGAFLSQTNVSDPRAFPPDTTDFVLTVTDSVGCVDTDTVRINVKPAPPANAGPDQAICFGDTAQFAATGGVAYLWLANDSISQTNIPNPQVWPGTSRDYVVVVSGANQCSWPDTLTLTVNPLPVADAGPDLVKCGESPIPLNGGGGVQYEWTPATDLSDPLIANPLAGPDSFATYALLVTDINGCQDTDTMNITAMYANAGPGGTICEGDSIRLQGSGGISYRWSPGLLVTDSLSASPLAFPGVTTDFIVTAFDPSGCSDTNVVRIVVNAYPPAFAGPDTAICINDTLRLRASGGISFAWAPNAFISDLTNPGSPAWPTVSSTFVVAVTDTNGCTQFDSVRITVNPLPLASAGPDRTKCGEDSVLLAGSGGVLYEWTPALALNDPLIAQPLASPDSAMQYTVRVTDANGCVNFDSVQVETLYANAGPDLSKCPEDSVLLFYGVIGGNPVSRVYLPAPGLIAPAQQNFVYVTAGLTNDYVLEITDASGCVDRDTVNVFVFTSPPADAGRDTAICIFEATPLTATGGITFDWRSDRDLSAFTGATVTASPRVSKYFFVTVTDTNGCRATDSVRVTVNPLPEVGAGFDTTICARSAAFLEATGALTYVWTPDGSLTDPLNAATVAAPEFTTMYTVTGTDGNGCRNVDSVQVNVRDLPTLQTDLERRMCAGQEIWLRASGAQQIRWFDNQQGDSVRVAPMSTRTYWVQPFNDGCPGDTFFIEVEVVRDLPIARFEPDPAQGFYPLTVNFTNTSEFASVYRWDFGNGNFSEAENPSHEFVVPGQYAVRLLADNGLGCPDTFTYTFIDAWNFTVYYPNAFTPNGDGTNDEFFIEMNSIREVRMEIFNQWGELIYVSDDPDFRWDGTHQGRDVQEGVYVFHFRAVTFRGEVVERGGTITLIR
jgi:gliding motility-associated-like protein